MFDNFIEEILAEEKKPCKLTQDDHCYESATGNRATDKKGNPICDCNKCKY